MVISNNTDEHTDPPESESAPSARPPTQPGPAALWRQLILRWHFYAGILVGPFLLIAAISGGAYAIAPTLETVIYRAELHTDSTGAAKPIADQVRSAMAERPDLTIAAVRPARDAGETTRVMFTDTSLGESKRWAVFIDPVTAKPQGQLVVYGSSGSLPMRTWIDGLHRNLHLGDFGRNYSEIAASWLWIISLGGLFLWYRQQRQRRRDERSLPRRMLTIDRKAAGRTRTLNWHGAVGVWIVIGLLFLSATGLTWSKHAGGNITELRQALHWTQPTVATSLEPAAAKSTTKPTKAETAALVSHNVDQLDRVYDTALASGITDKAEIGIPSVANKAFTVTEVRNAWQFSPNSIAINGDTASVTSAQWFADWPIAAKMANLGIALHMGILFGLANQIALVLLAIALVTVIARGYRMWWQRRPRTGSRPVGRTPARGAFTRLPASAAVGIATLVITLGYALPWFGIPLALFLAVDVARGLLMRGRPI
ncbi:PepSY-associated TM helix domain-containing protein [Tsukamurella pseudospumae]|uniref:PepSY-associated TM helix domain-containing protein n=1 Tax=Tsukamurella pseudospumae TaxID=239498 RepID=UPI000AE5D6FD|nr:PepSY-associated TM helix domain-containing protein [Tsukamurella pseudospumae]